MQWPLMLIKFLNAGKLGTGKCSNVHLKAISVSLIDLAADQFWYRVIQFVPRFAASNVVLK